MEALRAGDTEVVIDEVGGRIASLVVGGLELVVTAGPGPIDRGFYPMAPFAGRIRHGRFTFDGVGYELPCNLAPHAIHGTVLDDPWSTDTIGRDRWCGSRPLGPPWPFGGTVMHDVRLATDRLVARLEVRNDDRPMPATCGWHPWWRRSIERGDDLVLDLDLDGARMYERDTDGVPDGRLVAPTDPPWDDCFTHLSRPPALRWPGALVVTCETTVDHWVVFTRPEHAACVEPQTGPPDAFNLGSGFAVVEPGRPLVAEATWRWSLDAG